MNLSSFLPSYLRHGVGVRLLLGVGPVDDDITVPDLDAARLQPPLGQRGALKGEGTTINDVTHYTG